MLTQVIADDEAAVDPLLGYPKGYSNLCRHAHKQMQGLITSYTEGPPQCFLPYTRQEDQLLKEKEFNSIFPIVPEADRDPPNARKYAITLWQQLDHLGNAGFDPGLFRMDTYGNVLYWNADPASPLYWEVDHWFPHSRGGKTIVPNLRIIQCQVNQRKKDKLEFLVPWWDLQLGISVNQFLSAFASNHADFRKRCFSYFFKAGEGEQLNGSIIASTHLWPSEFRDKRSQSGLAAAAIVRVQRDSDEGILCKPAAAVQRAPTTPGTNNTRRRWSIEEEEALKGALQKFGPGNWKEIKEFTPALATRTTVQIKDKYRLMKGDWNLDKENVVSGSLEIAVEKEMQLKLLKEREKKEKDGELVLMQQQLKDMKQANEREHQALLTLHLILSKHKTHVEQQRRWTEMQSSYRHCLERLIRDCLHQSVVYKEEAQLNQAACNALIARLESEKSICQAAEINLIQTFNHKLTIQSSPDAAAATATTTGSEIVDVSSCLSQPSLIEHKLRQQAKVEEEEEEEELLLVLAGLNSNQDEDSRIAINTVTEPVEAFEPGVESLIPPPHTLLSQPVELDSPPPDPHTLLSKPVEQVEQVEPYEPGVESQELESVIPPPHTLLSQPVELDSPPPDPHTLLSQPVEQVEPGVDSPPPDTLVSKPVEQVEPYEPGVDSPSPDTLAKHLEDKAQHDEEERRRRSPSGMLDGLLQRLNWKQLSTNTPSEAEEEDLATSASAGVGSKSCSRSSHFNFKQSIKAALTKAAKKMQQQVQEQQK